MLFESTRGEDKAKTFEEVLLKGLADDGGLYIPTEWPKADIRKLQACNSFIDIAKLIVPLFTESSYKKEEVITLLENTWHDFEKSDLVGIKKLMRISLLVSYSMDLQQLLRILVFSYAQHFLIRL